MSFYLDDRCMTIFRATTIKFKNNGSIVRFRLFNVHLWNEHLVYIIFTQFFTDQCYDYGRFDFLERCSIRCDIELCVVQQKGNEG